METKRGPLSLRDQLALFLSELDNQIDPEKHPEIFNSGRWDRLYELQEFSSRIKLPSKNIIERIISIRDAILNSEVRYLDKTILMEELQGLERNNRSKFNSKPNEEEI